MPCLLPRDLPDPEIKPASLTSPALAGGFFLFVCLVGFFFFLPLVPPGKQACNRKNSKTASEFLSQSASSIREELCNSEQGSSSLEIQFFLW